MASQHSLDSLVRLNHLARRLARAEQIHQITLGHRRHGAVIWLVGDAFHVENRSSTVGIGVLDGVFN